MVVENQIEADTGRNRCERQKQRTDPEPGAGRFDRRYRNWLWRWRRSRRHIDLRKNASTRRLSGSGRSRCSATNRGRRSAAAHHAEDRPRIGLGRRRRGRSNCAR